MQNCVVAKKNRLEGCEIVRVYAPKILKEYFFPLNKKMLQTVKDKSPYRKEAADGN